MKYLGSISDSKDLVNKGYVDNLIAPAYSSSSAYSIGQGVIYNNKLYKCNTAIPSPGETWTSAHWTEVKMANTMDDVSDLKSALEAVYTGEQEYSASGTFVENYYDFPGYDYNAITVYHSALTYNDAGTTTFFVGAYYADGTLLAEIGREKGSQSAKTVSFAVPTGTKRICIRMRSSVSASYTLTIYRETAYNALSGLAGEVEKIGRVKNNYFDKTNSTANAFYTGAIGSAPSASSNSDYWCGLVEVEPMKAYFFPRVDYDMLELDENQLIIKRIPHHNYDTDVVHNVISPDTKYIAFSIYKYAGSGGVTVYTPDDYIVTDPGTDITKYIKYPYEVTYDSEGMKKSGAVVEKVYYVGSDADDDYSSFIGALRDLEGDKTPKTIYVRNGVYDIYSELGGAEYLAGITASDNWKDVSVIVPDNTKIIGLGDVTFLYRPPAEDFTIGNQVTCVSPLNVVWNCEIENIKIFGKNCRYCIHDEAGSLGDGTPKRKKFKNVIAVKEPNTYSASYISGQAYASGMIEGYSYEFENCYFKSQEAYVWTCHTGEGDYPDTGNVIVFNNCVFESPSWAGIRFGSSQGTPTGVQKYCKVSINNCYIQNKILLERTADTAPAPNQYELWLMNTNNVTIRDRFAEEGWPNIYTPKIFNTIGS